MEVFAPWRQYIAPMVLNSGKGAYPLHELVFARGVRELWGFYIGSVFLPNFQRCCIIDDLGEITTGSPSTRAPNTDE